MSITVIGIIFVEMITLEKANIKPIRHKHYYYCGFRKKTSITVKVPQFDEDKYGVLMYAITCSLLQFDPSKRPDANTLLAKLGSLSTCIFTTVL